MSDANLRLLEREATREGTTDVLLRLARALARAGRLEEALGRLLPRVADAAVREAVLTLPAWRHVDCDAGRTRMLHAPGLSQGRPALLWTRRIERRPLSRGARPRYALLSNPLHLVVDIHGAITLDPATGLDRRSFGAAAPVALDGDVLLVHELEPSLNSKLDGGRDLLVAYDLHAGSGERLHSTRIVGPPWGLGDGLLATDARSRAPEGSGRHRLGGMALYAMSDTRSAPARETSFCERRSASAGGGILACGTVISLRRSMALAVEPRDGAVRFSLKGLGSTLRGDAQGVLGTIGRDEALACYDATGHWRWGKLGDPHCQLLAAGPDVVALGVGGAGRPSVRMALLSRATGDCVGLIPGPLDQAALACDVVYVANQPGVAVAAYRLDGSLVWSIPAGELRAPVVQLAPGIRLLHGLSADGTVFCLGEPR